MSFRPINIPPTTGSFRPINSDISTPTIDESGAALSHSQNLLERQSEADQAKKEADAQSSVIGIGTETAKGTFGTFADGAAKLAGSAIRSPIDIVRGLFGKKPMEGKFTLPSGKETQSYAGEAVTEGKDVGETILNKGVVEPVLGALDVLGGEGLLKSAYKAGSKGVRALFERGLTSSENKEYKQTLDSANKIINPYEKYTASDIESARKSGEVKVKKGIFGFGKKEVISPNTTKQTETLGDMIKSGKISEKRLPQENINSLKQEVRMHDSDIDELINRSEFNKGYNPKDINKRFDSVVKSAMNNRTFLSKSSEETAYKDIINLAKEEINKNPKNNAGLRKSIKAFNRRMEDILGKDIYSQSGEPTTIGKARLQGAKDLRTEMNTFLSENLGDNPQVGKLYKGILQKEAHLLNAADELSYNSRSVSDFGKSTFQRFVKRHPTATGLAKKAAGGAAVTVGGGALYETGKATGLVK